MKPQKEKVAKRIYQIRKNLGYSMEEFGKLLGDIPKSTVNNWEKGISIPKRKTLEKIATVSGRTISWLYFGNMEAYIREYLEKRGFEALLKDYPKLPQRLKNEFVNSSSDSWDWKNEYGYPSEEALDEAFAEIYDEIMQEYLFSMTKRFVETHSNLEKKQKEEIICLVNVELYSTFSELKDFKYGDEKIINDTIKLFYESNINNGKISFSNNDLIGKLINILEDEGETFQLLESLSTLLTGNMNFRPNLLNNKLVEILQSIRPALIQLYMNYAEWERRP